MIESLEPGGSERMLLVDCGGDDETRPASAPRLQNRDEGLDLVSLPTALAVIGAREVTQ